jgi:hypothetical protein
LLYQPEMLVGDLVEISMLLIMLIDDYILRVISTWLSIEKKEALDIVVFIFPKKHDQLWELVKYIENMAIAVTFVVGVENKRK